MAMRHLSSDSSSTSSESGEISNDDDGFSDDDDSFSDTPRRVDDDDSDDDTTTPRQDHTSPDDDNTADNDDLIRQPEPPTVKQERADDNDQLNTSQSTLDTSFVSVPDATEDQEEAASALYGGLEQAYFAEPAADKDDELSRLMAQRQKLMEMLGAGGDLSSLETGANIDAFVGEAAFGEGDLIMPFDDGQLSPLPAKRRRRCSTPYRSSNVAGFSPSLQKGCADALSLVLPPDSSADANVRATNSCPVSFMQNLNISGGSEAIFEDGGRTPQVSREDFMASDSNNWADGASEEGECEEERRLRIDGSFEDVLGLNDGPLVEFHEDDGAWPRPKQPDEDTAERHGAEYADAQNEPHDMESNGHPRNRWNRGRYRRSYTGDRDLNDPQSIEQSRKEKRQVERLDYDSDADSEYEGEGDIDKMLEQPVNDDQSKFAGLKEAPMVRDKVVLKYRGAVFGGDVLPEGWIEITHASGVPVYLHKKTRICTLARPYFLGPSSVRHHVVPVASIPCLFQRQVQEAEKKRREAKLAQLEAGTPSVGENDQAAAAASTAAGWPAKCPAANKNASETSITKAAQDIKLETHEDFKAANLTVLQLREYCAKSFEFETIKVRRFRNWSDHRTFHRRQKATTQRPGLPSNVKLITVPGSNKKGKPTQRQFFLNPAGKTSISILHEYVQRVFHCSPKYDFTETQDALKPFKATVKIESNGTLETFATGCGNSKKTAKLEAARLTVAILLPDLKFEQGAIVELPNHSEALELFDNFDITDRRVTELSTKAGQPTPFQILLECLKRNAAFGNVQMEHEIKSLGHQRHAYTIKVGDKHAVSVPCSNKREGKQFASQEMLKRLHANMRVTTWGSLLRLYGYGSQRQEQVAPEKQLEMEKAAAAAGKKGRQQPAAEASPDPETGKANNSDENRWGPMPNKAILDKLKKEMAKYYLARKSGERGPSTVCALLGDGKKINI